MTPTRKDLSILEVDAFTLTLFWPASTPEIFSLDRLELYDITQSHVKNKIEAELLGMNIELVTLSMQTALSELPSSSNMVWTELVTGTVKFAQAAPIPSSTLQTIVLDSFDGDALELYEIRLRLAQDPSLKKVSSVKVGLDYLNEQPQEPSQEAEGDDGSIEWTPLLVVIVSCVVGGVILACGFAYFLMCGRKRRRSKGSSKKKQKSRELPGIPTDPTPPDDDNGIEYSRDEFYHKSQNHAAYNLNGAESSDAESSLLDIESQIDNQSIATSTYSYREETSRALQRPLYAAATNQAHAPIISPLRADMASSLEKRSYQNKSAPSMSPRKGGFMGSLGGLFGAASNTDVDQSSYGEDEYGFEKEGNPNKIENGLSMDDESVLITVDDYDNRSLVSDGRVGQILGDVHSIAGAASRKTKDFDDVWNDETDDEDDIAKVLNTSMQSIPFDERVRTNSTLDSKPFDEKRVEQEELTTPRNLTLSENQIMTLKKSNVVASAFQDDASEEVEDYDHHCDASSDNDSTFIDGNSSIASDSYGFVYQKYYHSKPKPLLPSTSDGNDEDVNLTLPRNLKQPVVDLVPGVMIGSNSLGDDQSVEVSLESKKSDKSKSSVLSLKSLASSLRSEKSEKHNHARVVSARAGMSARKKNSEWGSRLGVAGTPEKTTKERPTSPAHSVQSSDSAKFRALLNQPDIFDAVPSPERKAKEEAKPRPTHLLKRMPSDDDSEDCYLDDDDQPTITYPANLTPSPDTNPNHKFFLQPIPKLNPLRTNEEKKDDSGYWIGVSPSSRFNSSPKNRIFNDDMSVDYSVLSGSKDDISSITFRDDAATMASF
jgi:hypothetical protein